MSNSFRPKPFVWLVSLLVVAGIVRALVLLGADFAEDRDSYAMLAINWDASGTFGFVDSQGEVSPTAFRPPLYPWLLSWLVDGRGLSPNAVAVLHWLMGLATVALTYSIAAKCKIGPAWLPAAAVAFDPLLLRASQLIMTETLAALLVVLAWRLWLAVRASDVEPSCHLEVGSGPKSNKAVCSEVRSPGSWVSLIALGIVFGLAVLARPTAAPWTAVCVIAAAFVGGACWKRRGLDALILGCGIAVCVAPWMLRNLAVLGKPIWATSHGGYTLYLANNPELYEHFDRNGPSRAWDATGFHAAWLEQQGRSPDPAVTDTASLSRPSVDPRREELRRDALAYKLAWETISTQPMNFFRSSVYRLGWFWAAWPNPEVEQAAKATPAEEAPTEKSLTEDARTEEAGSEEAPTENSARAIDASPRRASVSVAIGLWYLAWYGLAFAGFVSIGRAWRAAGTRESEQARWQRQQLLRHWIVPLALICTLSMVHAVYWSNMRMRSPIMSCVYMMATLPFSPRRV